MPTPRSRRIAGRGHFLIMEEGAAKLAARCADWIAKVTN